MEEINVISQEVATCPLKWNSNNYSNETSETNNSIPFDIITAKNVCDWDIQIEWIIPDIVPEEALGAVVGKPKTYKTTFLVHLALAVSRGDLFLGRKCMKSKVLYLFLEGGDAILKESFEKAGLCPEDEIIFINDIPVEMTSRLENLEIIIQEYKPKLIIIDTFAIWENLADENNYGKVYAVLSKYIKLNKEYGTSIFFTRHSPKNASEGSDGVLGSTAFWGSLYTKIFLYRNDETFYRVDQRCSAGIEDTLLFIDHDNGTIAEGKKVADIKENEVESFIIDYIP